MSDRIPEDARSFALVPERYERGRPEYPKAAIDLLVERLRLGPQRRVLDLAAGTGKLTRRLVETGADVVAVEPVGEMRALLPPAVEALDGVAEAIPLPDASVDAVTVGQAFHWFRPEQALVEIHRVLRPDGLLALIWNRRDEQDAVQQELGAMLDRFERTAGQDQVDVEARLAASGLFGPVEETRMPHSQELDAAGVVDRFLSVSFVAAAPPAERAALEHDLRERIADLSEPITLPYVTEVYVAPRLP